MAKTKFDKLQGNWQKPPTRKKKPPNAKKIYDFMFGDEPDAQGHKRTERPPVEDAPEQFPIASASSLKKKSKTKLVDEVIRLQTLLHACACTCGLACKGGGATYIDFNPESSVHKVLTGKEFENLT